MLAKQRFFLKPLTIIEIVTDDDMKLISLRPLPEFTVSKLIPIDIAQTGESVGGARRFGYFYCKDAHKNAPRGKDRKNACPFFSASIRIQISRTRHRDGGTTRAHNSSILVT